MKKVRLFLPVLAGFFTVSIHVSNAATITQSFAGEPLQAGWQVFGDASLFQRETVNEWLAVTWDSSKPNSYFHHPLGTILSRDSDFSFEFDLQLTDAATGHEPGKTGGMQLAIGFLNLAGASNTNFMRAAFGSAPNVVEFDYFVPGYYEGFGDVPATTTPTFISQGGFAYAPSLFIPYIFQLPTNEWIHVALTYTASNQTLVTALTTNGVPLVQLPDVVLNVSTNSAFSAADDFRVDTFSISSYSSAGNDFDSILAHGFVDNIVVTVPPPPVQDMTGKFGSNTWQVRFVSQTNWLYTLERTADFTVWNDASPPKPGNGSSLTLQDTNPPAGNASYRVRAERP